MLCRSVQQPQNINKIKNLHSLKISNFWRLTDRCDLKWRGEIRVVWNFNLHISRHQHPADTQTTVIFAMIGCVEQFTFLRTRRPKHKQACSDEKIFFVSTGMSFCFQFLCVYIFIALDVLSHFDSVHFVQLRFFELNS